MVSLIFICSIAPLSNHKRLTNYVRCPLSETLSRLLLSLVKRQNAVLPLSLKSKSSLSSIYLLRVLRAGRWSPFAVMAGRKKRRASPTRSILRSAPISPSTTEGSKQKSNNVIVPVWLLRLYAGVITVITIIPGIAFSVYMFQEELREVFADSLHVGSMISLQWSLAADRVLSMVPSLQNITASNISVAYIMFQDASFLCAFAWYVL